MSLRQLTEAECANANPLMQLGAQFTRDAARQDEGLVRAQFEQNMRQDQQMVHEFLGQIAGPPQTFQMNSLLQELRDMEIGGGQQLQAAPRVIDEVAGAGAQWSREFGMNQYPKPAALPPQVQVLQMNPTQLQVKEVREFFEDDLATRPSSASLIPYRARPFMPLTPNLSLPAPGQVLADATATTDKFFEDTNDVATETPKTLQGEDWINDYEVNMEEASEAASNYNQQFWQRLQDEFEKLSAEEDSQWLKAESEDVYDPYVEYSYANQNPMSDVVNPLEKGKEYLAQGQIPKAVLCFEVASQREPDNAEVWEMLGFSQAENENDPNAIYALKRAVELNAQNPKILMALAICYTNENFPAQALTHINRWLQSNPKYKDFTLQQKDVMTPEGKFLSSIPQRERINATIDLFLRVVRQNPQQIDPDIQEGLGVLYNITGDFDKAVDCFQAAVQASPQNAKLWNRLGASLANGSRSVEAVEAYQNALALEPGFIRVRYNVGVCCMNLKAYKQAVEHLLTALNMQASSVEKDVLDAMNASDVNKREQMSKSIWSTLKMVLALMGRSDLSKMCNDQDLTRLNEAFKNDFQMESQ